MKKRTIFTCNPTPSIFWINTGMYVYNRNLYSGKGFSFLFIQFLWLDPATKQDQQEFLYS